MILPPRARVAPTRRQTAANNVPARNHGSTPAKPRAPRPATRNDIPDIAVIYAEAFAVYLPRLGPAAVPDNDALPERISSRQVFVIDDTIAPVRRASNRSFGSRSWARPVRHSARSTVRPVAGPRSSAGGRPADDPIGPAATVTLVQRGRTLVIADLAVSPRHQHRGMGRNLLMFAEMMAYRRGLTRLEVTISTAMWENQALYARMGFEELDSFDMDDIEYVQLFKRLGPDRRRRS